MPNDNRDGPETSIEERAAAFFVRQHSGEWTAQDQADLAAWLADPACASAYQEIAESWRRLGDHATSPELLAMREQALARTRQPGVERWSFFFRAASARWTAAAALLILAVTANRLLDRPGTVDYMTGTGEQRIVELADRSRIALDAQTLLEVRLAEDSREIEMAQGQAQFMVASDPRRPFRVHAGGNTITAVGTSFNVEYLDSRVQVTMVEGKASIGVGVPELETGPDSAGRLVEAAASRTTDLVQGQEVRIEADGRIQFIDKADIEAAVAWRQGKIVLKDVPLSQAVRRLNRYSRLQIEVSDPSLGAVRISGVFEAGDMPKFVGAVQSYLPVSAHQAGPDLLRLSPVQH